MLVLSRSEGRLFIYVPTTLLLRHVIGNQAYCLFATNFGKVWVPVHTWVRTQHCGKGQLYIRIKDYALYVQTLSAQALYVQWILPQL